MTESQKTAVVIIRLLALYLVVRGGLGILGFAAFEQLAGGLGSVGMALGSVLVIFAVGAGLWFVAPAVGRLVTHDLA